MFQELLRGDRDLVNLLALYIESSPAFRNCSEVVTGVELTASPAAIETSESFSPLSEAANRRDRSSLRLPPESILAE